MSLIYDYLKIHGKGDLGGRSDADIPPPLKRHIPARLNTRNVPAIIGVCLAAGLFLFFVYSMFVPEQDTAVIEVPEPLPQVSAPQPRLQPQSPTVDTAAVTETEPVAALQEEVASPVIPEVIMEAEQRVPEKIKGEILVFPEPEVAAARPVVLDQAAEVYPEPPTAVRKKIPQPLELSKSAEKKIIADQSQVYAETEVSAINDAAEQPAAEVRDVYEPVETTAVIPVQKASGILDRIDASGAENVSTDRSRKFYQAGLQAQMTGDQREAEAFYKKALEVNEYHIEAMINLSALYVQQQRYDQAEDVLLDIFKVDPENSKALVNMGMISLYKKDIVLAEEQFQAALDANPYEENALINLAYLAEKRGDSLAAERYYRNLLQISPDNIEVRLSYGYLLEEGARYSEAVALYEDCLKLDSVKNDQELYDRIRQRIRQLSRAARR